MLNCVQGKVYGGVTLQYFKPSILKTNNLGYWTRELWWKCDKELF